MVCSLKKNAEDINASGIRAKMCDIISEEFKRLIKEQVDPWIFFNSKGVRVKKLDGGNISCSGVGFEGSSQQVFWNGYIEPYIADVIKRMMEETICLTKDSNVPISAVLESTKANLSGGIDNVYHKMQEVDRRLRGKGYPESISKRDVSCKIKEMNNFLDRQIEIYKDLTFQLPEGWFSKWYNKNPHLVWILGAIIIPIIIWLLSLLL